MTRALISLMRWQRTDRDIRRCVERVDFRALSVADVSPSGWTALAAWVAVMVLIAALLYAWRQYQRAREDAAELMQPNVSMFMEPSASDWHLVELVVKNFGKTPAYGIRFEFAIRRPSASTRTPTRTATSTSRR